MAIPHDCDYSEGMDEELVRMQLFKWLHRESEWNGRVFDRTVLEVGFPLDGRNYSLIGPQGIWFPAGFSIPISITSVFKGPYRDDLMDDGLLKYDYRKDGPNHRDNVGLRTAYERRTPLVYFKGIRPSRYVAVWPVFVLEDHPTERYVRVAIDPAYVQLGFGIDAMLGESGSGSAFGIKRYITTLTKQRLHQTAFRDNVLSAYNRQCAMCRLQHPELLDAAHIIPDNEEGGDPIVPNGLSLCKIHHAAYDRNILGITPDYQIRVSQKVLDEVDGPMLKYGLQAMDKSQLTLPKSRSEYPDRERLDRRYRLFAS